MCKDFTSCKAQYKNLIFMIIWEKRAFWDQYTLFCT
jgi:hypothetical protein